MSEAMNVYQTWSAATRAVKDASSQLCAAAQQYVRDYEFELREDAAKHRPDVDADLIVAEWLAGVVHQNQGSWSGGPASDKNAIETTLREAAGERLRRLLSEKLRQALSKRERG